MSSCFRLLLTATAAAAVAALLSVAMPESAQLSAGDGHGHSAVLITGGGGGIGRAVGEMLEAEGWLVFVTVRKEVRCCANLPPGILATTHSRVSRCAQVL